MTPQGAGGSLCRDAGDRPRHRTQKGNRPGSRTFRHQPAENYVGSKFDGEVDRFSAAC